MFQTFLKLKNLKISPSFIKKISSKNFNLFDKKMVNNRHAQTQHGNGNLVDTENITVLRTCHSPSFSTKCNDQNLEINSNLDNNESDTCVWFFDQNLKSDEEEEEREKSNETNEENKTEGKRKLDDSNVTLENKKVKVDSKDFKLKRPGFSEDRFDETSYYFDKGLRKVYPYHFTFTTFTKGRWVGKKIIDIFSKEFRAHPIEEYERSINAGTLTVNYNKVPIDYVLKHNDLLANTVHRHEVPVTNQTIKIIEMDENIVVVNKPASIPVHPCGRYRHNTVVFILAKEYNLKNLRTIHRLDRLTSGLLLFGRNPQKAREMEVQIRNREVKKEYICLVEGKFPDGIIECNEPIEVVSYKIGVCKVSPKGKDCKTLFERLYSDGETSTVLCKPRTGRMHQIRVHLQYLGYPIVNDPLYNHEVFGPFKGKGGDMGGKSDDELVMELIRIHNAENWLSENGDDTSLFKSPPDINPSCTSNLKLENSSLEEENKLKDVENDKEELNKNECKDNQDEILENKTSKASQTGYDDPDKKFNSTKMTKDQYCYECKVKFADPKPQDLVMYLHALKYEGPNWKYETEMPNWAKLS